MLVEFKNVTFGYDVPLLRNVSFALHENERVGLLGGNGEGKTTILKLLAGELSPDDGTVTRKNGMRLGYLEQTGGFTSDSTVYGAMKEVLSEDERLLTALKEASEALSTAEGAAYSALSARIESLQRAIAARDSYHFEVRIKTVLGGMGFEHMLTQKVDTMSGGERTKLKLCRLLLEQPDLLVLDEPTNHLDIKTLFWLEEFLSSSKSALLIVSHDRYFLDKLTSRTLELDRGRLASYKGSYSKYKVLREERFKEEMRAYERQQEEIAKLQNYVDRNLVRATTAKSALSRVNRLERMDVLEKPLPPLPQPKFRFETEEKPYEKVLAAERFDLGAGGKLLLENASFCLMRGERAALVGSNGTGKSTLLKFFLSGDRKVTLGRMAKPAFYDQENADLDPEARVLDAMWERCTLSQTDVRKTLAQAGLGAEDIEKKVKELSGGMRAKLSLAILETQRANLLILDEPTNHLDLPAREALEDALKAFEGTLLFVSHDRRFIESLATVIFYIEGKSLNRFEGSYAEFLASRSAQPLPRPTESPKKTEGYRSKEERAKEAQARNRTREIEARLEAIEDEEKALNEELISCASDYKKVQTISEKLGRIRAESDVLYAEYETLI